MTPPEETKRAMVQGWYPADLPDLTLSQAQRAVDVAAMVRDAVRDAIDG